MPLGLDLALKSMAKGEVAVVTLEQARFGWPLGHPPLQIPAGSAKAVTLHVQLCGLTALPDRTEMGVSQKLVRSDELRADGNGWFKRADFGRAHRRYTSAADVVEKSSYVYSS